MKRPKPSEGDQPHNCPLCNANLLGDVIPEEHKMIAEGEYFWNYYKREIGIERPEIYDGIWHFRCPDCDGTFGGIESIFKKDKNA